MKLSIVMTSLALLLGSACSKKNENAPAKDQPAATGDTAAKTAETPKEAPKAAAKGRSIPNANGLVVDAPAKWLDNGIGGAAGMHLDADGGNFTLREAEGEEAAQSLDDWKKGTEEVMFQKWISADAAPDGFKAIYVLDKLTMKGEEMVKDGSVIAFTVRRKIGDKTYVCSGSGATEDVAKEAIDLCYKVAAS
jgi:hypothetical protein